MFVVLFLFFRHARIVRIDILQFAADVPNAYLPVDQSSDDCVAVSGVELDAIHFLGTFQPQLKKRLPLTNRALSRHIMAIAPSYLRENVIVDRPNDDRVVLFVYQRRVFPFQRRFFVVLDRFVPPVLIQRRLLYLFRLDILLTFQPLIRVAGFEHVFGQFHPFLFHVVDPTGT